MGQILRSTERIPCIPTQCVCTGSLGQVKGEDFWNPRILELKMQNWQQEL